MNDLLHPELMRTFNMLLEHGLDPVLKMERWNGNQSKFTLCLDEQFGNTVNLTYPMTRRILPSGEEVRTHEVEFLYQSVLVDMKNTPSLREKILRAKPDFDFAL